MATRLFNATCFFALVTLLCSACDFEDEIPMPPGGGDGSVTMDGDVVDGALDATPGEDGSTDGAIDAGADAGPSCGDLSCGVGQRCEMSPEPMCVDNTCDDLMCPADTLCEPAPSGSGFVCADNSCADDVDCPAERFCSASMICEEDVCTAGVQACVAGGNAEECLPNGSGTFVRYRCGLDAAGVSLCREEAGRAFCPCVDDWDCPAFTECEVDRCVGSGMMPTCFLPPSPITDLPPALEVEWGGRSRADRNASAPGPGGTRIPSPFPESSQAVMTPVVANLDDDNGDGLIDERDFPEVIFMTFCGSQYRSSGVLRAVHGGGPRRGQDFFATCGSAHWQEGDTTVPTCVCGDANLDPTGTLAVGDLDGDGTPEIVVVAENDRVMIFDNYGNFQVQSPGNVTGGNQAVSLANVDGAGFAEIVVGREVLTVSRNTDGTWVFLDHFEGTLGQGKNPSQGPISCVADLDGDGRQEIIGGSTVYRFPRAPAGVTRTSECSGSETDADEVAYCRSDLVVMWDGRTVNGGSTEREGFCAVADVWGADASTSPGPANPLDGSPEVLTISAGRLQIFRASDGTLIHTRTFGGRGGAPNVDDFDGDGFPEIGTAFSTEYILLDLQDTTAMCPAWNNVFVDGIAGLQGNTARTPPTLASSCAVDADCGDTSQFACNALTGQCVCLHNGWQRRTEDDSSQVTGSSVFDFNGDGAAEVIYNDECYFRIYGGLDGTVYFRENAPSRTRTENPVVADVDNDGNAEIIFSTSNESGFCSGDNDFNNGLEIWGDPRDEWVGARRIYNQHSYHVTNVTESGAIPVNEPPNWLDYGGRVYNSYRSQPRSLFGIAPDLTVGALQFSSPDAMCGTLSTRLTITARIVNQGDLRVGADVPVTFHGVWMTPSVSAPLYADASMTPLSTTLGVPLEAGGEVLVSVSYDAVHNAPGVLPDSIRVAVDEADMERECIETNNERVGPVEPGESTADLTIALGAVGGSCPLKTFETTVSNIGSASASAFVVRYYAGDPNAGGEQIHEEAVAGPIAPGGSTTFTATVTSFPSRSVVVYAVVDPDNRVLECNDANNTAFTETRVDCTPVVF